MEITSALPDLHFDEAQPPDSPVTPEKENQSDGSAEGPPAMSSPVQFIGINYFPPSPIDVQTTSQHQPPDPTPWESGAVSPLSEDYVVVGLPTFPPKPCVLFSPVSLFYTCPSTPSSFPDTYTHSLFCSTHSLSSAAPGKQGVATCRFHRTVLGRRDAIRCSIHHLWDGLEYITRERSCAWNVIIREARLCNLQLFIPWSLTAA
jgi:hypothetical protein